MGCIIWVGSGVCVLAKDDVGILRFRFVQSLALN